MQLLKRKPLQYSLFGIIAIILPMLLNAKGSTYTLLASIGIISIAALGFNILLGYSGQISLGHGAFMGMGAYMSAYLVARMELPFIVGLVMAAIVPLLVGFVLGLIALRLEGHYLAIATLGFAVVIEEIFAEFSDFTGGWSGTKAGFPVIFGYKFSKESVYVLVILVLVGLMIATYNFMKSSTGRALIAMKKSEHAAQAMGVSLFKYKLLAFSLSTMYAGIAGSLYIHFFRFCEPKLWGIALSLDLLASVVIGGIGTIGGAVVGVAFLKLLPTFLQGLPILGDIDGLAFVLTGVSIIIFIMFYPKGLINIPNDIYVRFMKRGKEGGKDGIRVED
ncbi:branched-chain amino acid ABC transporter permease [Fusibacter ferrireducens]|uniref:Branched-chain amino acid ABC transporter permease n=1 Tax=Fusibacter ferrireducens TaxID=2785058 RepID=A0ABR9ZRF3_9FIRM|nr:branched-chain amino acid ABC transporter permease [Fusibacter ferrireducens]MBF4693040.1 branched-chain amino acid ABC transporter permease [Fusibacter ferrireducens]